MLDVSNWKKPSGGEWRLVQERVTMLAAAAVAA
jgi:hypothetical protein